ncbi:MAG: hypothetical protein ACOCRC_03195, partial [Halodesulfurarchaeum sp.]
RFARPFRAPSSRASNPVFDALHLATNRERHERRSRVGCREEKWTRRDSRERSEGEDGEGTRRTK